MAFVGEIHALEGHRTVVAQLVGVEKHAGLSAELIHHIEHALVLQTVVLVEIPFALALEGSAHFLVVGHLFQAREQFGALGQAVEIGRGDGVLFLHPSGGLCAGVILQPTVGVGDFHAEIGVHGPVLGCRGIGDFLCHTG